MAIELLLELIRERLTRGHHAYIVEDPNMSASCDCITIEDPNGYDQGQAWLDPQDPQIIRTCHYDYNHEVNSVWGWKRPSTIDLTHPDSLDRLQAWIDKITTG
jgi:hypothetical protein